MSDKNPYYSIPKALGEPKEEIEMLPVDPNIIKLQTYLEEYLEKYRKLLIALMPPHQD